MTTVMSSSQLCDACHSSGTACCSHDFTCLRLSCTHQVPDGTTAGLSLSLARDGQTSLHEFQFFGSNDTATGLLRSTHDVTPMVEPVIKYQENPRSKRPLTLDIYSSTISSSNHPSGSSPMEVSIMGQMISSANAVSLSGKMLMDASTKSDKAVPNTGTSSNGDDVAEGEARILRYKEKKAKRNFERQIRYPSRKTNAEMRPRVRGRFTKS